MRQAWSWLTATALALVVACGFPTHALGAVIFSNFGPGDSYDVFGGWGLQEGIDPQFPEEGAIDIDQAGAFTPVGTFVFDRLDVVIDLASGPNELDLYLMASDATGGPGDIIEAFHISGAMQQLSGPPLSSIPRSASPLCSTPALRATPATGSRPRCPVQMKLRFG